MGSKYEVFDWRAESGQDYKYHAEYDGQSLFAAVWTMIKLKHNGSHCIKFMWK